MNNPYSHNHNTDQTVVSFQFPLRVCTPCGYIMSSNEIFPLKWLERVIENIFFCSSSHMQGFPGYGRGDYIFGGIDGLGQGPMGGGRPLI